MMMMFNRSKILYGFIRINNVIRYYFPTMNEIYTLEMGKKTNTIIINTIQTLI